MSNPLQTMFVYQVFDRNPAVIENTEARRVLSAGMM
jgi:hypothetical protein